MILVERRRRMRGRRRRKVESKHSERKSIKTQTVEVY